METNILIGANKTGKGSENTGDVRKFKTYFVLNIGSYSTLSYNFRF